MYQLLCKRQEKFYQAPIVNKINSACPKSLFLFLSHLLYSGNKLSNKKNIYSLRNAQDKGYWSFLFSELCKATVRNHCLSPGLRPKALSAQYLFPNWSILSAEQSNISLLYDVSMCAL